MLLGRVLPWLAPSKLNTVIFYVLYVDLKAVHIVCVSALIHLILKTYCMITDMHLLHTFFSWICCMLYVMCYVLYVVLKAAEVETAASHSTCASAATVRVPQQPQYVCLSLPTCASVATAWTMLVALRSARQITRCCVLWFYSLQLIMQKKCRKTDHVGFEVCNLTYASFHESIRLGNKSPKCAFTWQPVHKATYRRFTITSGPHFQKINLFFDSSWGGLGKNSWVRGHFGRALSGIPFKFESPLWILPVHCYCYLLKRLKLWLWLRLGTGASRIRPGGSHWRAWSSF